MYKLIRPLLFMLDPERAHNLVSSLGKVAQGTPPVSYLMQKAYRVQDDRLRIELFDTIFENPVGLAAGFDKNAELIDFSYDLGFGFTEVGSATARGGEGNPKPRIFRYPKDEAIVNRMGLNNIGTMSIVANIKSNLSTLTSALRNYPIGLNIAKTNNSEIVGDDAIKDFVYSFRHGATIADYITINISCPNTKEGKTFEDPVALDSLLGAIKAEKEKVPTLVKISPTLHHADLEKVIRVCTKHKMDGYVVSNTQPHVGPAGTGGLSGKPLREISTEQIRRVYEMLEGAKPIIGVGGIDSAETAYEKIKAGASLVQVYTGLIYQGPSLVKEINKGILRLFDLVGFKSVKEAVGIEK
ncbi:quinone-dependent dihydroorotate dehydrogenase [Nanoarchaeota archaeon]